MGGGSGNKAGQWGDAVAGGTGNTADGAWATVPGGKDNTATYASFAAGTRAKAISGGSFVWGDSTDADVTDAGGNTFVVRATGGAFFTNSLTAGGIIVAPAFSGINGNINLSGSITSTGLRIDTTGSTPSVVAGFNGNSVTAGVNGAAIGGGGYGGGGINRVTDDNGTVGGGSNNRAGNDGGTTQDAYAATVAGGNGNTASGREASVGGGEENTASGFVSTVGGGAQNVASGSTATVGGGQANIASGQHATVAGGASNVAAGITSFADGYRAKALHDGAFVWGDLTDADVESTGPHQFVVRATGGAFFSHNLTAGHFFGDGSALTGVNAATAVSATSATTAATATNALALGGVAAANYARTDVANTFNGSQAIQSGNLALAATTSASVGVLTLGEQTFLHVYGSASNTFVGTVAGGAFATTGQFNTGTGYQALYSNTTGGEKTASGGHALGKNTTGNENTAIGINALWRNTSGSGNTASGAYALSFNTTGAGNAASGYQALQNNTDASCNTASGYYALTQNCSGVSSNCPANYNTALGYYAGVTTYGVNANVTGAGNTFLGASSGPGTSTQLNNATAIGYRALVSASNALVLGGTGAYAVKVGIGTATPSNILTIVQDSATDPIADSWATYSSRRWKTNIQTLQGALDKVARLRGVSYDAKADGQHNIGLIAEEVGEVVPEVVAYEANGQDAKSVDYARLSALLIEAVKEQQAEIRELKTHVERLTAELAGRAEIAQK